MARQNFGPYLPFTAGADLSDGSGQFRYCKLTGAGLNGQAAIGRASVAGELCIGLLQDRPKANETATVLPVSACCIAKVYAGVANLLVGSLLTCDNQGRAVIAATGNRVLGISCQANAAVGDLVEILLLGAPYISA